MILHLFLYEWKRTLKHPTLLLFVFLFPILFVSLTGFIVYSVVKEEVNSVDIVVLDEDQTFETSTLINQLKSDDTLKGQVNFITGEGKLTTYLQQPEQYAAVVQVPKGFTEDLRSGINREINVYLNENIPVGSNLAYLLLESGQNYISAAQSGVNTVNHFYIKTIEDRSERNRWIQQMTIHFTLLTLSRNDFFVLDESLENEMLNWTTQLYLTIVTVLFFLSYLLWIMMFQQKNDRLITERLTLISLKPVHRLLSLMLYHFSFSLIYLVLFGVIASTLLNVSINFLVFVQWVIFALMFHSIYLFCYSLFKKKAITVSLFFILTCLFLMFSGLIIPPAYIGQSMIDLTIIHDGFKHIFLFNEPPIFIWLIISIFIIITVFFSSLLNKKGEMI
ncbi:ABC transporter permease [Bacillaceae bacterium W0354]